MGSKKTSKKTTKKKAVKRKVLSRSEGRRAIALKRRGY